MCQIRRHLVKPKLRYACSACGVTREKHEIWNIDAETWNLILFKDAWLVCGAPARVLNHPRSQPANNPTISGLLLCLYRACHLRFYHTLNYIDCFCTSVCTCILFCSFLCLLLFFRGVCALLLISTFSQGLVIWIMVSTLVGSSAWLGAPCPFSLRCGLLTGYLKVRHTCSLLPSN